MKISTLQWNIGGGYRRKSIDSDRYELSDLGYFSSIIKMYNPDFIFLQETHANDQVVQVEEIAEILGYEYFFNDIYAKSHLDYDQKLGQGIISKFPVREHRFTFFKNPKLKTISPNGETWVMHNKGVSRCAAIMNGIELELATLHMFPFRKFGVDPKQHELSSIIKDVEIKIAPENDNYILQGDFNIDDQSLVEYFPKLFERAEEIKIKNPTTPKGRKYDHIIYKGLKLVTFEIKNDVLADHYPVYAEFEL